MGTPCHQQVGESLRTEQHQVCCYCEVEVAEDNCHIEHMVPRSVGHSHYDYANLAASCDGGAVEHCGRFKDDRHQNPGHRYDSSLFCLPHDPVTVSLFQYLPNGSVLTSAGLDATGLRKAEYMIGYLGLQCARLVNRRRVHARQLIDTLGSTPDPDVVTWAIGYYLNPDEQGRLRQFSSLSKKILNQ